MRTPARVTVYWKDIVTHNEGWEAIHTARKAAPVDCQTTGYLISKSKTKVVIAASWGRYTDGSSEEINLRTTIPVGCVVRIETLVPEVP